MPTHLKSLKHPGGIEENETIKKFKSEELDPFLAQQANKILLFEFTFKDILAEIRALNTESITGILLKLKEIAGRLKPQQQRTQTDQVHASFGQALEKFCDEMKAKYDLVPKSGPQLTEAAATSDSATAGITAVVRTQISGTGRS